jgi:hypothetical protein
MATERRGCAAVDPVLNLLNDKARLVLLVEPGVELDRLAVSPALHSSLPRRPALCAITALAARRMVCVER